MIRMEAHRWTFVVLCRICSKFEGAILKDFKFENTYDQLKSCFKTRLHDWGRKQRSFTHFTSSEQKETIHTTVANAKIISPRWFTTGYSDQFWIGTRNIVDRGKWLFDVSQSTFVIHLWTHCPLCWSNKPLMELWRRAWKSMHLCDCEWSLRLLRLTA